MYSKIFTRLFLLLGMIGLFSAPMQAEEVTIGSGNDTQSWLPSHSNWNYSLTQQIYKAEEIGEAGTITSIAFYNAGSTKTRTYDIYLVNTSKSSFSGASDWISVTSSDLVFSGSITMTANTWTSISLSEFQYEGENLAVVVNDKTGSCSSGMTCRVFTPSGNQGVLTLYAYRDNPGNYDLSNPGNASGTVTYKNQIILNIETAAVTCAKPKNFNAESITAHEATLTWTAGAEGQSNWDVYVTTTATDVPDENTSPTYQVTTCSKALSNLAAQTTYYAYVRANCGGGDYSKWASKNFTTTREALTVDATHPYSQDFETSNDWGFTNGSQTNQWCWGSATNNGNGGQKAIYVTNDNGTSNAYTLNSATVVYASKLLAFTQGTYTFVFDWKAYGESGYSEYDYLRVALAPGDMEFTASTALPSDLNATSLPSSWIALDGGHQLNKNSNWQSQTSEATVSGTYTMVFVWRNDGGSGENPPAAIDNISISYMTCPRPTGLTASNITGRTATLTWTENGTATNWVLQYATNNSFTENLVETNVSGTASKDLSGLSPETKYYARVKSVLGNDESSWSDVKDFTTTATCEKPTLSYVPNSNTAYTGTVSWTGDADNYELIYSTATSFNPGDEGVTQIDLGNVNTYTLQDLTPETTYRIKVRANCGAEDGYSQWSNQVSFTTTATCVAPTGLSATKTATTITLSWTAGAEGQDAWDIRYKKGSGEYTYVHLDNQATTSHTIENLSPATAYSVNVRAYCSETDQSKWGYSAYNQNSDLSVTTECGALTMPYNCDFEGALETSQSSNYPMPKCWTRKEYRGGYYGSYTYYPSVMEASYSYPYAHGGNGESATSGKSMHFYKPNTSTDEAAILPEVDAQYTMSDLQISFWARLESYQTNKDLSIGVMTDPSNISTFVEVATVTVKDATFQEYTAFLENYTGEGRHIAIRFNSSTTGYIFVDDITVDVAPTCRIPKDINAETTDLSATLTWTAGLNETAWNVQYKKASDSEWSEVIPVNSMTYTLTQLKRATVYEARVQAVCSTDDQSDWAEVSFTTDCGIWPIDAQNGLFEDFENIEASDFPPICWEKFNHEMNGDSYWYLNANNGLGSGAAYSSWNEGYAFLVMPKMHIDGNANLSFDYLIGSGNYNESCSIVVSTEGMTYGDFYQTIWAADGDNLPSGRASATISLSDYDEQDIYVAFKFKGSGTSGCTWYIDNVHVYVGEIFTKDITAYSGNGGYYLIASPIGEVNPEHVVNMLANNYDLYYFDQSATDGLEWINYKSETNAGGGFSLQPGKGYLYANSQNVTLKFIGTPYGDGTVSLDYDADAQFPGWNLIGNPFGTTATLDKPYYRLNTNGSALKTETESTAVAAMEGVFVQATAEGQNATFTPQTRSFEQAAIARTNIVVSSDNGNVLDNAIIRFDNGETLGKFQLRENSTKVYIPVDGKDYAIVNVETQSELPVNFKAAENGTYSINVSAEEVKMSYLHLIDNMTGDDINLLESPSYSFKAKTTDYPSRFKLVFAVNEDGHSTCSEAFAIFSNGKLIVLNEGQATLQVIDMMGRVLNSETLSGNAEISLNQVPGIYMLRLIDGENVKTQKIVVR